MKKLKNINQAKNFKDLTGQQIKHWTILKRTNFVKRRDPIWECKCICGKIKLVSGNSLRNGSGTCGCSKLISKRKFKNPRRTTYRSIMARYNCDAINRNLRFALNFNDFKKLITNKCFYCNKKGTSYQTTKSGRKVWYNGIDRVDNTKGYVIENCVTCCKICNTKKKSITPEMIKKAYEFLFG